MRTNTNGSDYSFGSLRLNIRVIDHVSSLDYEVPTVNMVHPIPSQVDNSATASHRRAVPVWVPEVVHDKEWLAQTLVNENL
jgi:hypothetical protein